MKNDQKPKTNEAMEIDLLKLLQFYVKNILVIILVTIVAAGIAFAITCYAITPKYEATTKIYVNNSSVSLGSTSVSISGGDISASQSLVDTYIEILRTRTTLNEVIEKANLVDEEGEPWTFKKLNDAIESDSLNSTQIFYITVTDTDPERAQLIANTIAEVLPTKINEIVKGSSAKIVDYAVKGVKSSPSIIKNTAIGVLIGLVLACGVYFIVFITDNEIHDENYILETYDFPLLAVIPDLTGKSSGHYGKYGKYGKYKQYGSYYGSASSSKDDASKNQKKGA